LDNTRQKIKSQLNWEAEVKTLVNEFKSQGRYSVNFNASNLSSGVYIYRIKVNDFSTSKKLLLMK